MGWITDLLSVVLILWGFPGSSDDKKPACSAGNLALIPGSGRSLGEGKWQPTPVFLPGESHRGAWQAAVHEVVVVGHDRATNTFTFKWKLIK